MVILDGPPKKPADAPEKVNINKRKRGAFANNELAAFTSMTVAMKNVAHAIRHNKAIDMHHDLHQAVMDMIRFTEEDLMAAEPPRGPQGLGFQLCGHERATPILWLRNYLGKYYYNM
ncbi:hypothetical protein QYE76_030367 [Lolium multiflorum]|uniref:Uncharacterized protein n=1 Tax=Lolium multiflorum TaxID=4521 RepID=A0AAD8VHI5_LOLMU|nr:hypothetical protein QYE76_030367 [Lolium multiflorum]